MTTYLPLYDPAAFPAKPTKVQEKLLSNDDSRFYAHVGCFAVNFGHVEFYLTLMLWDFTGGHNAEAFHLLTRGMDASVKTERLRKAIKLHGSTIGPNLKIRLAHFENAQINLRNKISHSDLNWDNDTLHFGSVGAFPRINNFEYGPAAETISGLNLIERAIWLNLFCQDLMVVVKPLKHPIPPGIVEINHPLSGVPKGGPDSAHP